MQHHFELTAAETSLTELLDAVQRITVAETKSDALGGEIRLLTEEALTNVMKYAYEGSKHPPILAEVLLAFRADEVVLEIRDRGSAFDPLTQPIADVTAPLENRREGGLGIHLLRSFADEVGYRREGNANVLSLKKRIG